VELKNNWCDFRFVKSIKKTMRSMLL
jgi:hypothetical protein